jgi:hypothetical protein
LLRGALLLVVCGLCGTFDILNNNFARWVARVASFPEEEEHHAKDRSALAAAAQPSRRGTVRPPTRSGVGRDAGRHALYSRTNSQPRQFSAASPLTGAGIFQHC